MRLVVPSAFVLQSAGLDEAQAAGLVQKLFAYLRSLSGRGRGRGSTRAAATMATHVAATHAPPEPGTPVALRWSSMPELGFPRAPFRVWRRRRDYKAGVRLSSGAFVVSGATTVSWPAGEMYEVLFNASPSGTLVVEALDAKSEVIPGQRIVFTTAGMGVFRSPGIAGLRLSGAGSVSGLLGVDQHALANDSAWELIQHVGLPFDASEISAPAYTSMPQGYEPPTLEGLAAAHLRLTISQMLQVPPPDTGIASVVTPAWPAPDPKTYLRVLRDPSTSPLALIAKCLQQTDDTDPSKLQGDYIVDVTVPGIKQNIPGAAAVDTATAYVPVVGATMLAVANDSDAATGLGYGTVDIPPQGGMQNPYGNAQLPDGVLIPGFDHMVTADFVLPIFGSLELAALGQGLPLPDPAASLQATATAGNRPAGQDTAGSEVVTLSWTLPSRQQGYGLAVTRLAGVTDVLNAPRDFSAGGYDPFIPLRPPNVNGVPPLGVRVRYTDPVAPLPVAGSITSRYLVLGRDVAGRWSPWTSILHTATAPPVETPGLLSAALELNASAATGRVVPATAVIEFSWEWEDRTPAKIELFGTFFAPAATPSPTFTGGFATVPTGTLLGPVVVTFDAAGNPVLDPTQNPVLGAAHPGSVVALASTAAAGTTVIGDTRRYRLRVGGLSSDFSAALQVAYAVTARGYEQVRPTVASAVVGPRIARADDPLPAAVPTLPIQLMWTALPDAAGQARAVLTWPASPGATGYVVWEATETALRRAASPTAAAPAPGTSILARAGTLRTLVTANAANRARSLKAFSRMHERPIPTTSIELELPGSADTLYAYRVSSLTGSNVESERSATVALVAVSRRSQPGRPRVLLRRAQTPLGIDVIILPGPGVAPAGYRIHRVRKASLTGDVGLMGPAKYDPASTGWAATSVPANDGTAAQAKVILDPVTPSWYAYHYRVVAIGPSDPANGVHPGESPASGLISTVLPPTAIPVLDAVSRVGTNTANQVITFRTDLPVRDSPLGRATITVTAIATVGGDVRRQTLLSVDPTEVREGPALTVLTPGSTGLAGMPHIARAAPDASGRAVYTVRLPASLPNTATGGAISVTDPLGRSIEVPWP